MWALGWTSMVYSIIILHWSPNHEGGLRSEMSSFNVGISACVWGGGCVCVRVCVCVSICCAFSRYPYAEFVHIWYDVEATWELDAHKV